MNQAQQTAAQLRKPTGEQAPEIAERMEQSNQALILQAYAILAAQTGEQILEVGPGSGKFLEHLITAVGETGLISALDYSPEMVQASQINNQRWLEAGRFRILEGQLSAMPFADQSFDALCSNNTLYFWDDPTACLTEIRRVLKTSGRLVLGFRSRQSVSKLEFTQHGFTLYSPAEACSLLEAHGFEILHLIRSWPTVREGQPIDAIALMARKA